MVEAEDLALIRSTLAGDKDAFAGLIDRYQKPIFNVALRMLGEQADAEDVTQAVFIKAYENLGSFKSGHKFFSWIYRMAINESINFLKRRKRHGELPSESIAHQETPESEMLSQETTHNVTLALQQLKPEQRSLVIMKHFQDLTYAQIGRILQVPEKTVKSRLYEARQKLREIYYKTGKD